MTVLNFLTLAAAGFLWLLRRRGTALYLLASVASGVALSTTAKALFDRPRPDLAPARVRRLHCLVPLGPCADGGGGRPHARRARRADLPRTAAQGLVMSLAVLVTVAVGLSRVYLGVHWPTDVLAGWAAGGAWALACAALALLLSRRGTIEAESAERPGR